MPFLLECILQPRPGGTNVEIDGKEYHFGPNPELDPEGRGRHVCLVENVDHFTRFVGIPEGYRLVKSYGVVEAAAPAPGVLAPESAAAPTIDETKPEPVSVTPVEDSEPEAVEDPAAPTVEDPAETEPDQLSEDYYAQVDEADLRSMFQAIVGRAAHPKAKRETMIAQIIQKKKETGETSEGEV